MFDLVNNAKNKIYIQSPYLITTDLGLNLFESAIRKGAEVHVLTNSLASTDNAEAFRGYQRSRKDLLQIGVNIYEYKPDASIRKKLMKSELQKNLDFVPIFGLHAKSMVVDGEIAVIGTFNLDPRSAHLNTECLIIIHSIQVASDMEHIMKEEQASQNAWTTTLEYNPDGQASFSKRFKAFTRRIVPKSIL
ncbi:MAG: putative cardiolipin synthase [Saprospiraceae bacterium]